MDIIVRVIDYFGDVGVAWRLAISLKQQFPERSIRILIDDETILKWLRDPYEKNLVEVILFENISPTSFEFSNIIIESLGCRIPADLRDIAYQTADTIIHLEALSAETWIETIHRKESLLNTHARRFILCPGFTSKTLGLMNPMPLDKTRNEFMKNYCLSLTEDALWVAVYTYDIDLSNWRTAADHLGKKIEFIVLEKDIPHISQRDFDTLLSLCDFNIVRGEDSFATSLQLGKPTLWQAYRQEENIHRNKVKAFILWAQESINHIPAEWVRLMNGLNGIDENITMESIKTFIQNIEDAKKSFIDIRENIRGLGNFAFNLNQSIKELMEC